MYSNNEDQKAFQRKHYQENKALYKERNLQKRKNNKRYVEEYKKIIVVNAEYLV